MSRLQIVRLIYFWSRKCTVVLLIFASQVQTQDYLKRIAVQYKALASRLLLSVIQDFKGELVLPPRGLLSYQCQEFGDG